MNNLTASQTDYLKAIYLISLKGEVKVTKIADYLNYSKPSVVRALKNLRDLKLIIYENQGLIKMTSKGKRHAKDIIRRDNVLKKFMIDILGVDKEQAAIDSENMKHAISCYTITKLEEYINNVLNIHDDEFETDDCVYDCNSEICASCGRFIAE
ncbi:MAG TPA: metal-dependent transcriptional regulator [Mollicutes bacterium]|jgi:Mn-dependent DtxR family transcriptional regulator|nr:metal-dependent transcriptional regulator [Mollicutes bacterium]